MTVGEIERRLTMHELAEWMAYTRHFEAIPNHWHQTGLIVAALLAPYSERGRAPKPTDFVPVEKAPQHPDQVMAVLQQLKANLEGG
jgi:predicted dienelactone hydrolase